jgi:hypothetical protein
MQETMSKKTNFGLHQEPHFVFHTWASKSQVWLCAFSFCLPHRPRPRSYGRGELSAGKAAGAQTHGEYLPFVSTPKIAPPASTRRGLGLVAPPACRILIHIGMLCLVFWSLGTLLSYIRHKWQHPLLMIIYVIIDRPSIKPIIRQQQL